MNDLHIENTRNQKLRNTAIKTLALFFMLFSVTTLFQSVFVRISINRLLGALIVIFSAVLFGMNPERKPFICVLILIVSSIFAFLLSIDLSKEVNDWLFFFVTVLLLCNISNRTNVRLFQLYFLKYIRLVKSLVLFECVVLLVLLATKTGYVEQWGTSTYFVGLCNTQHTMASLCCLIGSLILLILKAENRHFLYYGFLLMIPAYAILETGARVFLIPLAIILYMFVQYAVKNQIIRALIYLVGICAGFTIILNSNMFNKFAFVTGNIYATDALSAFTSGRSEFWAVDISYFMSGNIFEIFLGTSFSHVYAVNLREVNMRIWAHNDIIHLLNGGGILGVYCYSYLIGNLFKRIKGYLKDRILYLLLILYMVIPMMLNGFFPYQHFVYSFIVLYVTMTMPKGVHRSED